MNDLCYNMSGGNGCPLGKGEMPMYITYDDVLQLIGLFVAIIDNHIQLALLIVTVVALLRKIKRQKDEKK